ncbi:MAG: sigma-70 family RNA polymerase sigma factor [Candidatus Acidiferrales bacterium]|jgi:RNA polymerase sigma-70 factor (ECF subfamily)
MTPRPVATAPPAPAADFRFPRSLAGAVERCWQKAAAPAEWNLTRKQFEAALGRSVVHRFSSASASPEPKAIESYLESLHAGDLAFACACSAGSEAAWDGFVAQFRQDLYRAARAIAGDSSACELADSLYADLYGLRESEGRRKSLFDYFHGRSKLGTWLRAVLAQRHVDAIRRARKLEPLEDEAGREHPEVVASASPASHAAADPADPNRAKYLSLVQAALASALDSLEPRDRLRLAYYYADELTLAEIGRLFGEHEATVSRKLDRARRDLRHRIEAALRDGKKLSEAQIQLCFEYAREEWPFDLTLRLRPASVNPAQARRPGVVSSDD